MKTIDLPPVWLIAFLGLAWAQATYWPALSLDHPVTDLLSGLCIGGGIVLMLLSLMQFRKHQTTVHPHGEAANLIQTGVYKRSRNPIYVADVLLLAGFILYWDAVLSLPLIPIFVWLIERRFIIPEENRLRRQFRVQYAAYERKVRRWI